MQRIDLSGRVALITGASRGIGLAIAQRLAAAGATVVLNARTIDEEIIATFDGPQAQVFVLPGDVGEPEAVGQLIKTIFSRHKRLDILVNNAGIMRPAPIGMISDDDIAQTLDTNLAGVIHLIQSASRLMARSGGSIVNVSSVVGAKGAAGQLVYAASKAGIIGATLAASKELAQKGIRVNAVAPGYIDTDMTAKLGDEVRVQTLKSIGLGRAGTAEDVADAVLFLASDLSRYVTGQILGVDGGMVI
ncbi:3-oxoacyl-ACP reductase FabG [uncultured Hyphomicrobium sp.]|uniref:SDR family NAD(P)-dependent oxidoreductase n=1 Tax=uncultured Hyphomicrobium sp. TaxID=194373 RepID=UPI0025E5A6BB|nr:3-oxoacyl-ACP reductase FabG [uncultured Hyphomicrobium sp.]